MRYTKEPLPIAQQIKALREKGLHIKDEAFAAHWLSRVSYYRLRAYTYPFQDNKDPKHPFTHQVNLEQIIGLYNFDRELRVLVFDAIERIEIALRTQIIYQFSLNYGSHWQTEPTLYRDTGRFTEHLSTLQKEIKRSDETFIKHYRQKYSEPSQPPCWMSLEVSSLSTLSKLYQNLKASPEKFAVAESFGIPKLPIMENWLFCFSVLRNICAHHGRLWNRRLTGNIKLPYNLKHPFLTKTEVKDLQGLYPNKLYATLCAVKYMLDRIEAENQFTESLSRLLDDCPFEQYKEMGFPRGWQKNRIWI